MRRIVLIILLTAFVIALLVWIFGKGHPKPNEPFVFHTPAYQGEKDLKNAPDSVKQAFFKAWDMYVNRYTVTAATYNLSGGLNYTVPGDYYVNPKDDATIMEKGLHAPIHWQAFPGRVLYYLADKFNAKYSAGVDSMFHMVDIGPEVYQKMNRDSIVFVPQSPCNPNPHALQMLDPYGPRGWLDEYCEMGIKRNKDNKITKLHFTCENPEYYWTLWSIDPNIVLSIYKETLENKNIKLEDLYLRDSTNKPVIVRETGRPAYNPINKWNHGTKMTDSYGGAMHLTSPPNELSAEIVLAGGGAVLRNGAAKTLDVANSLICCSQFGLRFRHSDPHIGQNVYQIVKQNIKVTLLDPVGLYLQEPAYQYFTLPPNAPQGAKIQDCFRFVRGMKDTTGYPNNMILHMIMEVPRSWDPSITLSDFKIMGKPIQYGSQVLQAIQVQLAAVGLPSKVSQRRYGCAEPNNVPSPNYFTNWNVLLASFRKGFVDSANVTSNIVQVEQGSQVRDLALVVNNINPADTSSLKILFPQSNIQVLKAAYLGPASKFAHGKGSGLSGNYLYKLILRIPAETPTGEYDLLIYNRNTQLGIPVPDMIQVVPANSLSK